MAEQERLRTKSSRSKSLSQLILVLTFILTCFSCLQLLASVLEIQALWAAIKFTGTYADAKEHAANFQKYKQTTKRQWVTEKQDVSQLFGNVQTKLRTYGLREYVPPAGLSLAVREYAVSVSDKFVESPLSKGSRGCMESSAVFRSQAIASNQC